MDGSWMAKVVSCTLFSSWSLQSSERLPRSISSCYSAKVVANYGFLHIYNHLMVLLFTFFVAYVMPLIRTDRVICKVCDPQALRLSHCIYNQLSFFFQSVNCGRVRLQCVLNKTYYKTI
ncbi:hypothetical protein ABZP36_012819 [Zizania latifolia]